MWGGGGVSSLWIMLRSRIRKRHIDFFKFCIKVHFHELHRIVQ